MIHKLWKIFLSICLFGGGISLTSHAQTDCSSLTIAANFSFSIDELTVSFNDQSSSTSIYQLYWAFGDGDTVMTQGGDSVVHTYAQTGAYLACLIVEAFLPNGDSCYDTLCQVVDVRNTPCVGFVSLFTLAVDSFSISVMDLSQPNSDSSYWSFGDGVMASSAGNGTSVSHTYTTAGSYQVCLRAVTYVDSIRCEDVSCAVADIGITSLDQNMSENIGDIWWDGQRIRIDWRTTRHVGGVIEIYEPNGRIIGRRRWDSNPLDAFDIPLKQGVYFVRVRIGGQLGIWKLIRP